MGTAIACLTAALGVVILLSSCEGATTRSAPYFETIPATPSPSEPARSVLVGGDHLYPPFEFLDDDGDPAGFNIDLVRRIAEIMNLDITISLVPWSEARSRLAAGEIDMLAGMYRTEERDRLYDFTVPHFVATYAVFVPVSSDIDEPADLDDKAIVVHRGDLGHDFVVEQGLGRSVILVDDWPDVIEELASGRGDAAIFGMGQGMRELRRSQRRSIRMIESPILRRPYGMAVREGDAELLAILNEGLGILKATGEFDAIYQEWFGVLEEPLWWETPAAKTVAWLFGVGAILALLGAVWVVFLRREVRRKTKALQAALDESARAQDELRDANEAKSRFLANVSHELRTPLNGVMGMTDLLAETNLSDPQRRYLGMIERAAQQLYRVLSDLLDTTRKETEQLSVSPAPFDLEDVVQWIEPTLRASAEEKDLEFRLAYDGPPRTVYGDRERIAQIAINLAVNAIKFTETGSVSVTMRYANETLVLIVEDTGIGIPEHARERVFDPFVQGRTDEIGGLGLGLSIVKALVPRLGGSMDVRSEPNRGTRFTVSLPLPLVASPETTDAEETRRASVELSVLVVEDEAINRLYLTRVLEHAGYRVVAVTNGAKALEAWKDDSFHVVLMDVSMPVMNGLDATRELRARETGDGRERTPVIALTAHAFPEDVERCREAGMDGYVAKPYNERALFAEIDRVVRGAS
ncbi:MAG: transporter substrate-binding domain-containing protein [Spirochaetales bacterium]